MDQVKEAIKPLESSLDDAIWHSFIVIRRLMVGGSGCGKHGAHGAHEVDHDAITQHIALRKPVACIEDFILVLIWYRCSNSAV